MSLLLGPNDGNSSYWIEIEKPIGIFFRNDPNRVDWIDIFLLVAIFLFGLPRRQFFFWYRLVFSEHPVFKHNLSTIYLAFNGQTELWPFLNYFRNVYEISRFLLCEIKKIK